MLEKLSKSKIIAQYNQDAIIIKCVINISNEHPYNSFIIQIGIAALERLATIDILIHSMKSIEEGTMFIVYLWYFKNIIYKKI